MIFITDRMVSGDTHGVFNLAILNVIDRVFPDEKKLFFADQSHLDHIECKIDENIKSRFLFTAKFVNVNSKGINIFRKCLRLCRKIRNDISFFVSLLKKAKRTDYIFFTHIHPISLVVLKIVRFFFRNKKIYIVLHGEVDAVFDNKSYVSFSRLLYKLVLKLHQKDFVYIVLSCLGADMLTSNDILKSDELVVIHHPYLYSETNLQLQNVTKGILKVGYIGSLTERKNGSAFIGLLQNLENEFNYDFHFDVVGKIDDEYSDLMKTLKCVRSFSGYLDRVEFENRIQEIHYAIFLFASDQFYIRVSGAFFDAVEFNKPVIALRTAYFESIFNEAGDIGFLCDNLKGVEDLILELKNFNLANTLRYAQQMQNLINYKLKIGINNIAEEMKTQILK